MRLALILLLASSALSCSTQAERLADKCYVLGHGKAAVEISGEALRVVCE